MGDIHELAALVGRKAPLRGGQPTLLPRVSLHRETGTEGKLHTVYKPTVCFVVQGRKQTTSGKEIYEYGAGNYLVVSVEVPLIAQVLEASQERPLLCLLLELDASILGSLLADGDFDRKGRGKSRAPVSVERATPDLVDALIRLVRLLDHPEEIPVMGPLLEREILFRLLQNDGAFQLHQAAFADSRLRQVNKAINLIKHRFKKPLRIEALAMQARMSTSALHHGFKAITGISPLQYQKQIRLQEARRLMLNHGAEAAVAAYEVGYESPSQFSREYRRLFGAPPVQDISRLRMPESKKPASGKSGPAENQFSGRYGVSA
ncbi:MAG: AraC family transcriptional regulator [Micropepsaceae bacterium]